MIILKCVVLNMKLSIICFIWFTFNLSQAQNNFKGINLDLWDATLINKANTAADADFLTHEEKMVIFTTNLARMNGRLFCKNVLDPFMNGKARTKYTRSLYKDLGKLKELAPLYPQKDLSNIGFNHAMKSGKKGSVGHEGFDSRFKPVMGKYNMVAENCSYGFEDGITNAIQLLIDEGVSNLGHRKNMLSPHYNSVGVSIQAHRKYKFNCVIDFGKINQ